MARVRAAFGVVIAAVMLGACGAGTGTGAATGQGGGGSATSSSASATGVLHIVATEGPTCPVEQQGESCVRPYVGELDVQSAGGDRVAQPLTSADGTVDVTLPSGAYIITKAAGTFPALRKPVTATVTAGATTTASVELDTGLR